MELRLKWDQDPARVGVSLSIRLTLKNIID